MTVQEPMTTYIGAKTVEELRKQIILFIDKHEYLGQLVEILDVNVIEGKAGVFAIVEYVLSDLQQ